MSDAELMGWLTELEEITPWPWEVGGTEQGTASVRGRNGFWVARATLSAANARGRVVTEENARWIAAAPERQAALIAEVQQLRGLAADFALDRPELERLVRRRAAEELRAVREIVLNSIRHPSMYGDLRSLERWLEARVAELMR